MQQDDNNKDDMRTAQQAVKELQADVSSLLTTYHELAINVTDTLETRLVQSLALATPDRTDSSTAHSHLTSVLHQADLTPATLSAALPGSEVSAVWWRLYGRWCEVRELDVLLVGMMAGESDDVEQMDEVERRMRALGWEVPSADSSSSSSSSTSIGSRANDARGAAA